MAERAQVIVRGVVQGVGFRPYVYSLAARLGLKGYVSNTADGVVIDLEGTKVTEFLQRLPREAPLLSRITDVTVTPLPAAGYREFSIERSKTREGRFTLIPPDVSICPDCLRELFDPSDRRYLYPFINCTQCGPRYSITLTVPYDRPNTTMATFSLCPSCRQEYGDPSNRRFHAQPNACPECGPSVEFRVPNAECGVRSAELTGNEALRKCIEMLKHGGIVAIKGLGGFHLACDARNNDAVRRLRERKRKSNKPFAVMAPDADAAQSFCDVSPEERELLLSAQRPIVLLGKKGTNHVDGMLSCAVAPGNNKVGVMLPYTPLHYLLFYHPPDPDGRDGRTPDDRNLPSGSAGVSPAFTARKPHFHALVMTSGNLSEEPIVHDNEEAFRKLSSVADAFLTHDRDIFMRVDDSVVRVASAECGVRNAEYQTERKERLAGLKHSELQTPNSALMFIRRSRGYAPEAIRLSGEGPDVLAVGADLKNTFTLTKGAFAIPSQHIGDMENYETLRFFEESLANLTARYRVSPEAIVHDLHPGYMTTKWAIEKCGVRSAVCGMKDLNSELHTPNSALKRFAIQHHYAHIGSVMAEHGITGKIIGVTFDGTGYGPDGNLWGGEFLVADVNGFERRAQLRYVPLPGGEASIREPWRTAISYVASSLGSGARSALERIGFVSRYGSSEIENVFALLRAREFSPLSSGAGRLFDAVSAILGLCDRNTFEGEAAIALEAQTDPSVRDRYPVEVSPEQGCRVIDFSPAIRAVVEDVAGRTPSSVVATRFHRTVAEVIGTVVKDISLRDRVHDVALSGGTFQNRFLLDCTQTILADAGLRVFRNHAVPANDGGISLGQAYLVRERLKQSSL